MLIFHILDFGALVLITAAWLLRERHCVFEYKIFHAFFDSFTLKKKKSERLRFVKISKEWIAATTASLFLSHFA